MSKDEKVLRGPLSEERILDAMGLIDEDLLAEAETFRQAAGQAESSQVNEASKEKAAPQRSVFAGKYIGPVLAMAACVGIVIGMTKLGLLFNPDSMLGGGSQSTAPAAVSEEAAPAAEEIEEAAAVYAEAAPSEAAAEYGDVAPAEAAPAEVAAEEPAEEPAAGALLTKDEKTTDSLAAKDSYQNTLEAAAEMAEETAKEESAADVAREEEVVRLALGENEYDYVRVELSDEETKGLKEQCGEPVSEEENATWYLVKDAADETELIRAAEENGEVTYSLWRRK